MSPDDLLALADAWERDSAQWYTENLYGGEGVVWAGGFEGGWDHAASLLRQCAIAARKDEAKLAGLLEPLGVAIRRRPDGEWEASRVVEPARWDPPATKDVDLDLTYED